MQPLEVAIAVRLDLVDGRRPPVLAGLDDLVIPVGALDEADQQRGRPGAAAGPLQDLPELLGRIPQVGLQHDPGRRAGPELVLGEQLEHEVEHRLPGVERFHVDVQMGAERVGLAEQRAQPPGGVAPAEVGRVGAQQRRERRDLHRQVGARQRAAGVVLEPGPCRPNARSAGELIEGVRAPGRVGVGLGLGDGRLAEQVDGAGHTGGPQLAQDAEGRAGRLADDEAVGHVLDPAGRRRSERHPSRLRVAESHRRCQRRRAVGNLGPGSRSGGGPGRPASGRPEPRRRSGTAPPSAPGRSRRAPWRGRRAPSEGAGRRTETPPQARRRCARSPAGARRRRCSPLDRIGSGGKLAVGRRGPLDRLPAHVPVAGAPRRPRPPPRSPNSRLA